MLWNVSQIGLDKKGKTFHKIQIFENDNKFEIPEIFLLMKKKINYWVLI